MPLLRFVGSCSDLSAGWSPQFAPDILGDSCVGPTVEIESPAGCGIDPFAGATRHPWPLSARPLSASVIVAPGMRPDVTNVNGKK
jgi:hypothetical protein